MSIKFSTVEDERLIDLVREYPALYQVKSRSFKANTVKNNIWKEIGEKLGKSDEDCKARWKSIRDYYQRKKKDYLKETVTGSVKDDYEDNFSKKFQHLRFLDGSSVVERQTISNAQIDYDEEIDNRDNSQQETQPREQETEVDENDSFIVKREDEEEEGLQLIKIEVPTIADIPNISDNEQPHSETPAKRKRGLVVKDKNILLFNEIKKGQPKRTIILRDLINRSESSSQSEQEPDDPAVQMFFKSVAATVSAFNPVHKAKIKAEIMNIVSRYEIKQAMQQSNASFGPACSVWEEASNHTECPTPASRGYDSRTMANTFNISSSETSVCSQSANSYTFSSESCDESNFEIL